MNGEETSLLQIKNIVSRELYIIHTCSTAGSELSASVAACKSKKSLIGSLPAYRVLHCGHVSAFSLHCEMLLEEDNKEGLHMLHYIYKKYARLMHNL